MGWIACSDTPAVHDAPDLEALAAVYDAPDGTLDTALANELFEAAETTLLPLSVLAGQRFALDAIEEARRGLLDHGLDPSLDLVGRLRVRIICPGYDAPAVPDADRDGTLELTIPVLGAHLGPVAFGPARRCRFDGVPSSAWTPAGVAGQVRGELDGEVAIHFGSAIGLTTENLPTPLVRIAGTVQLEQGVSLSDLDFRIPAPGEIEVRVPLVDGTNVLLFATREGLGVRERRGVFMCSLTDDPPCREAFTKGLFE